ncbi:MAG: hypothetical protein IJT20_08055 [Synergistaceae bacterium]|nr:hypothetical protein [Synergistaceae bacterium]
MRIANNVPALTAFNSLNSANNNLQKMIKQVSTGLRINSAADDAAGLAISENMRAQSTGLERAIRNAQDGISFLQTAEGALAQTNSMLQRMRELTLQASNDSLTSNDRQYLQLEIDEIRKQIDRIADTTQFNNKRILDGSSGAIWSSSDRNVKAKINGGLTYIDDFGQKISAEGNYKIEVSAKGGQAQVQKSSIFTTYKTTTDYGNETESEEITETVRTVEYDTVTKTETQLVETVSTSEEIFKIYINGANNDDTTVLDNLISLPDDATQESIDTVNAIREGLSFENGVLTITKNGTYNIVGRPSNKSTTNRIKVADGVEANIFLTDVNIDVRTIRRACAFEIEPGAKANIYLSGNNTLKSGKPRAGLEVPDGATLTLSSADGDGQTTGTLTAIGGSGAFHGAGIGGPGAEYGRVNGRAGDITINGGTITAKGGEFSAGIGGGDTTANYGGGNDGGGHITINGGNITATGGDSAAGIGHGDAYEQYYLTDDSITINGGNITARGGELAAGIGGGNQVSSGTITISSNATIKASGYKADEDKVDDVSAIGRGYGGTQGANDTITYNDNAPVLRSSVPDRFYIESRSVIRAEEEVEITSEIPKFTETSRTVSVRPAPSLENELENVKVHSENGVDSATANGLPAGNYTVETLTSPLTEKSFSFTGSYGFEKDLSSLMTMSSGTGSLATNANILFEVTGVNRTDGTVTLKATANLMNTDGTVTKHIVREGLTLKEGSATALSGLNLSGTTLDYDTEENSPAVTLSLSSGAASSFSTGNKFVCNIANSGFAMEESTVAISGTQNPDWDLNWGEDLTLAPVLYGLDTEAVKNSNLTFSNFYLNSEDGTVYEGDVVINTNDTLIQDGKNLASFDALRDNPVTTTSFGTADETTRLDEIMGFYNTSGVFMIEHPQTISITQGNGQSVSVTLYKNDTIADVREKLNNAIAYGLGQGQYASENKFVSFVTEPQNNGLETVAGTFVIRSAIPGKAGELYFSGDEDFLNALGLNTIQNSEEVQYTASVYDGHTGIAVATNVKSSGNEFKDLIFPNVDVEIGLMAGLSANWDEGTKRFITDRTDVFSAMLHLQDNGTVFQVGANKDESFTVQLGDFSSHALGVSSINILTRETASRSIGVIDSAINKVSSQRSKIGAYENDLENTMKNLTASNTNLIASESRIRDADMSKSMLDLVKYQIIHQSGTSMLAQANQLPQSVLNLLQ